MWSASGTQSRKSPKADRPTAPTIRRTSRWRRTVMQRSLRGDPSPSARAGVNAPRAPRYGRRAMLRVHLAGRPRPGGPAAGRSRRRGLAPRPRACSPYLAAHPGAHARGPPPASGPTCSTSSARRACARRSRAAPRARPGGRRTWWRRAAVALDGAGSTCARRRSCSPRGATGRRSRRRTASSWPGWTTSGSATCGPRTPSAARPRTTASRRPRRRPATCADGRPARGARP